MRYGWVIALVVGTGCTAIFGLEQVPSVDRDNDNVEDALDNCPDDRNPDQSDFDRNGAGDACDLCTDGGADDVDADGIPDGCDGCVGINQDVDGDLIDDGCDQCINNGLDDDSDLLDDGCDPCVSTDHSDVDGDAIEDVCDQCIGHNPLLDADQDGLDDACDPCISTDKTDVDVDEIEDACDPCISTNHDDLDLDNIEDACDSCFQCRPCDTPANHDEDGDFTDDGCDTCKSQPAPLSGDGDGDGDGVGNLCDVAGTSGELFDAFVAPNFSWFVYGSGWSIGNDVAHGFANGLGPGQGLIYRQFGTASTPYAVRTVVHADQLPGAGKAMVFVADSLLAQPLNAVYCTVTGTLNLNTQGAMSIEVVQAGSTKVTTGPTIPIGQPFYLVLIDDGSDLICRAFTLGASGTALLGNIREDSVGGASWRPGLRVEQAAVDFERFSVITSM